MLFKHKRSIAALCVMGMITSTAFAGEGTVYYDASIKAPSLGNYQFNVETHEIPSHEYLPIVSKDYFPVTTAQFQTEVDNTAPSATYEAKALTKVDVVFAFGDMSQAKTMQDNIPNFESKLNVASNNIDAYVQKVETGSVDLKNAFQWNTDVSSRIGSISINDTGNQVNMYGNEDYAGKNAIWIEQKDSKKQIFSFDYSLSFGDSFSAAGVLINIGNTGSQLKGYAIVFGNTRGTFNSGGSVYEVSYDIGKNNGQFDGNKLIKTLNISNSGSLTIEFNKSYIKISGSGIVDGKAVTINCDSQYGSGFGFFSEHYSHGCNDIGAFNLTNMSLQIDTSKSLGEAISDVAWRDNSIRFIVYGEDKLQDWLADTSGTEYQSTITKLLNSNAYLIPLGTAANANALNKLVNSISSTSESKGKFFYNSPILTALDNANNYIIELVRNKEKSTQWILVNTPTSWKTLYNDQEHDLPLNFGEHDGSEYGDTSDKVLASTWGVPFTQYYKDDKILAEKWRFRHNYTYYDNYTQQETFHDVWLSDPVDIFPEPGLYRINYKRKDNPFYSDISFSNPFDEYRYWSTDYDPVVQGE